MIPITVINKTVEAEGIASFEFRATNNSPLPRFSAGSHVDVHLPSGMIRQYSLFNAPSNNDRYSIAVLEEAVSRGGSQAMHKDVAEGTELVISPPRNLFPLIDNVESQLLFAGGIGITPILSMAEHLQQTNQVFELHYSFRGTQKAAFVDYIKASSFASTSHTHDSTQQRMDIKSVLAQHQAGTHIYICGSADYVNNILNCARELGWPEEQLHRELFAASNENLNSAADTAFEVQISSSGQIFEIPAGESVLDVLYDAGIEIPASCEQGVCGSCITKISHGEPDHRDQILSDAEKNSNNCFTPCCSRSKSPRLVLEL